MSGEATKAKLTIVPRNVVGPKKSRRKSSVVRSYPPDFASREDIAYRLGVSISTVDGWIGARLFPEPKIVFTVKRWRWEDVEEAIERLNGIVATDGGDGSTSANENEFAIGLKRAATQNG